MKLVAQNLSCERAGRVIATGLSFEVCSGDVLLVTGPNGAGKTTLLRTIAGFLKCGAGRLWLEPPGGASSEGAAEYASGIAERCHFVGHHNGLKATLTTRENLVFWSAYLAAPHATGRHATGPHESGMAVARVDDALERFGLSALSQMPAGYLSAGQKRRLCLARLLVATRPIWLLDEPTASLDQASSCSLAHIVQSQVRAGGMVIAATHLDLGVTATRELRLGLASHAPGEAP